jgi:hypothetical protein
VAADKLLLDLDLQTPTPEQTVTDILEWLVGCLFCRSEGSGFEPEDLFIMYLEDNLGEGVVHDPAIAWVYDYVKNYILASLPGYSLHGQHRVKLAQGDIKIDHFNVLRLTVDEATLKTWMWEKHE